VLDRIVDGGVSGKSMLTRRFSTAVLELDTLFASGGIHYSSHYLLRRLFMSSGELELSIIEWRMIPLASRVKLKHKTNQLRHLLRGLRESAFRESEEYGTRMASVSAEAQLESCMRGNGVDTQSTTGCCESIRYT
jgi:hypothetical protein